MIYIKLFLIFFKIGLFTFGGGYAMLPLIQAEVERQGWLDSESLLNFIAVSESTPGPFAINISTYVGMETGGFPGAALATLGVVTPSFLVILLVAKCYERFKNSRFVKGSMTGLKPAVVGFIAAALLSVGGTVFFPNGVSTAVFTEPSFYISLFIFLLMLFLALKKLHPILIILASAAIGVIAGIFH